MGPTGALNSISKGPEVRTSALFFTGNAQALLVQIVFHRAQVRRADGRYRFREACRALHGTRSQGSDITGWIIACEGGAVRDRSGRRRSRYVFTAFSGQIPASFGTGDGIFTG